MKSLIRHPLPLATILVALILLASIMWHCRPRQGHPAGGAGISFVTDGDTQQTANEIDWSLVGQAIAALISAIVGIVQLFRDLFGKGTVTPAASQLIHDTIKQGGPMVPTAETLGDDLCSFTGQTGSGPAWELAMRVAGERLLRKYTITVKP